MRLHRSTLRMVLFVGTVLLCVGMWGAIGCNDTPPPGSETSGIDGSGGGDVAPGDQTTPGDTAGGCTNNTECTDPARPFCFNGSCGSQKPCQNDADCTDPGKPKCTNGVCDAIPGGCSSDTDCLDPKKPVCNTQTRQCVEKTGGCKSDDECSKSDPQNPVCGTDGKCGPAKPCAKDEDCPTKARPVCANGVCVPPKKECERDSDCKDPGKTVCSPEGVCIPGQPVCQSDADCKDPNNPKCVNGNCVPSTPVCQSDADCKDPANPKCSNGICGPECASNSDCKDANKPVCLNGKCEAQAPECTTDADCPSASKPKCIKNKCEPAPPECAADADCKDPAKPLCVTGRCTPKTGCKADTDCQTTAGKPYCELSSGQCQACVLDAHCKPYQLCDSKTYTCLLKPGSCGTNADCANPSTPICGPSNTCVACAKDGDCKALQACQNGQCVHVGCKTDAECTPLRCNTTTTACVACTADSHCPTGQVCKNNACEANKCTQDSDCKAPIPACNTASGLCVECTDAAKHCLAGFKCTNNKCVNCTQDADCTVNNPSPPYAPNTKQICTASKCVNGCKQDTQCNLGNICDNVSTSPTFQQCIAGCRTTRDCPTGQACQGNKCVRTCTSNFQCNNSQTERACHTQSGTCVQCTENSHCTQLYGGTFAQQRPNCDTTTRTCGCSADAQCQTFSNATRGICDTTRKICIGCKADTDCRRGFICNASNACITGCRVNTDCATGQVCNTTTNQCAQCNTNADCKAPTPVCDKSGRCVGCLADADCKDPQANKCDTTTLTCFAPGSKGQCQTCTQNSDCAASHTCTTVSFGGSNNERVCLRTCGGTGTTPCATGFVCGSQSNPTLSGVCYPNYGTQTNSAKSCKGLADRGKTCNESSQCGVNGVDDGNCSQIQNNICIVLCSFTRTNQCPTGSQCDCPSGYRIVTFNNQRYCVQNGSNTNTTTPRCVNVATPSPGP